MATTLEQSESPSTAFEGLHRNAKQAIEAFAHKNSHTVIESIGVSDGDVEQIAPCTPLQEGIIYHFLSSTTPLYCSSFTFELNETVDLERLQAAWAQAQSEVQVLRTRFSPSPDGYAQIVLKKDRLPWFHRAVESDQGIEDVRKKELERWIAGLDSLMIQLWEVGVITSPGSRFLCLNIFHALYDGNSLRLLLELVSRIYLDEDKCSAKPPNFLDVLHLGPLCKDPSEEAFWKDHLTDYSHRSLPRSNATEVDVEPTVQVIRIDGTESLDHLRKSLNVTEQAILHACWLLTLYDHYSFVPSLGIIASGRTIDVPGVADIIGPLFNTIPSNLQLRGLKSWSEVAQRCHDYHASTIPFQYTALRDIVRWLGQNPDEPLFESLFVFQRDNAEGESSTSKLWNVQDGEAQHEYPLAFEIARNGNQSLTATLAAKGDILSPEAAKEILSHFQNVLSDFAEHPDKELLYVNGVADETSLLTNGHNASSREPAADSEDSSFNWTSQASTIRDVIANLAGVEAQFIHPGTSIFEVGLDSIDAIKLSSRLSKHGIRLPVSSIMRHRNVKAMSAHLPTEEIPTQNGSYPKLNRMTTALTLFLERENLVPKDTSQILPATPIQEAMIAEMTASEFQHYYNHEILQLEPNVDLARLREAWRTVVKSHPILRMSFVEVSDPTIPVSYAQIVHGEDAFDFRVVDLNGKPIESIIEAQRIRAMNQLANSPLLSLTAAMDGDHTYLVLSISHALYDGWSINLLHEDVSRSYNGEKCTRPRPDAILEQILESSGERSLNFWRSTLSNCTPVSFPPGKNSEKNSVAVHRAEKPLSIPFDKAEAFCRRHGITMQALLVSCWSLVLATHVQKLDVIFGLVLSGRNVAGSENVMFPTMNTVAMRVILHGSRLELVKYVQETLLEISEHQHFPLRRARPEASVQNLFDTLFIYQKRPLEEESGEGEVLYQSTGGSSDVEYPICVEVEGVEKELVGRVACRGSVLSEEDTFVLLEHLSHVLSSIVDEEWKQTVEFIGETMDICDHSVVQDVFSKTSIENGVPAQTNGHSHEKWLPIEYTIRNVLSIVSGVPEDAIHKTDNIFQLGLDSISAIKVAALLKKQSVKLAVSDMIREGTITKMAHAATANNGKTELSDKQISNALTESLNGIDIVSLVKPYDIDPQRIQKAMPATAGQSYFLSMHSLNPEVFYPAFYYLSSSILSREILETAWTRLKEQLPILRTAFVPTSTSTGTNQASLPYVQIVLETETPNSIIWHENFTALNPSALIEQERGFGSIPVVLHACQTSSGTALTIHIHHALYDAVSLPSTISKLFQLCTTDPIVPQSETNSNSNSNSDGDLSHLVALHQINSPTETRQHFWQRYLGQIPARHTKQPLTKSSRRIQFYSPGLVPNMTRLEIAAKQAGLSIQSIFLALYARVHARTLSTDAENDLVVGLYLANRSHDGSELTPTLNIVPLRLETRSDGELELFDAARKIQDDVNEISRVEFVGVSLVEIAQWTGVTVDVCVNFLRLPEKEEEGQSVNVNGSASVSASANGNVNTNENPRVQFKSIQLEDLTRLEYEKSSAHAHANAQTNGFKPSSKCNGDGSIPNQTIRNKSAAIEDIFKVSDALHRELKIDETGTNAILIAYDRCGSSCT